MTRRWWRLDPLLGTTRSVGSFAHQETDRPVYDQRTLLTPRAGCRRACSTPPGANCVCGRYAVSHLALLMDYGAGYMSPRAARGLLVEVRPFGRVLPIDTDGLGQIHPAMNMSRDCVRAEYLRIVRCFGNDADEVEYLRYYYPRVPVHLRGDEVWNEMLALPGRRAVQQ